MSTSVRDDYKMLGIMHNKTIACYYMVSALEAESRHCQPVTLHSQAIMNYFIYPLSDNHLTQSSYNEFIYPLSVSHYSLVCITQVFKATGIAFLMYLYDVILLSEVPTIRVSYSGKQRMNGHTLLKIKTQITVRTNLLSRPNLSSSS